MLKFWAGVLIFLLASGFVMWALGFSLIVTMLYSIIVVGFSIVADAVIFRPSRARKEAERMHIEGERRRIEGERARAHRLEKAKRLETSGRFEDAAHEYEQLEMFEKAGEMRARTREKQVVVRRVDVSVDLNALLRQIKDGGITVAYRCPNCNASLKIGKNTSVESLRLCEHCGSEIEAMDIADFLRTALS